MCDDIKKYEIELKKKQINTLPIINHIIFNKRITYTKREQKEVLDDLKSFSDCDFFDLQQYEQWLEDFFEGDKTR